MLRAILIDDEQAALNALEIDLNKHCASEVTVLEKCASPIDGMKAIRKHKPDLVFLDIEMPEMTGFEMLDILGKIDCQVVFVSGFNQYAVKAFEISAIDYLLKPVDKDRLLKAVKKVKQATEKISTEQLQVLINNINPKETNKKIAIPSLKSSINGYDFIPVNSIMYCIAEGNFTYLHLNNSTKSILASRPLKRIQEWLPKDTFFRAHTSHLINRNFIQSYVRGDGGYVIMEDKNNLNVARSKKQELLNWLGLKDS